MELAPKSIEQLNGGITHDACLPSFHHGTCPRHLNSQVVTRGRLFFLYFFDCWTIWMFFWIFGIFGCFLDFLGDVGTTLVWEDYVMDWIRWFGGWVNVG